MLPVDMIFCFFFLGGSVSEILEKLAIDVAVA
jgi:hypothetical protein